MAREYKNSVRDQTTTTGTGTVTLGLVAPSGHQTIAAHTTGATVGYRIQSSDNTEWENGEGVVTNTGGTWTLTRATVYASSNSGSLVSFSSGTKIVMTGPLADDISGAKTLQTLTAASSASLIDTTSLTAAFKSFEIELINIRPAANDTLEMHVSTDGGATWKTDAAYVHVFTENGSTLAANNFTGSAAALDEGISTAANDRGISGTIRVADPAGTGFKSFQINLTFYTGTVLYTVSGIVKYTGSTSAINALKFSMFGANNIADGSIKIRGLP